MPPHTFLASPPDDVAVGASEIIIRFSHSNSLDVRVVGRNWRSEFHEDPVDSVCANLLVLNIIKLKNILIRLDL